MRRAADADTKDLQPPVRAALQQLDKLVQQAGGTLQVNSGYRSPQQQEALWKNRANNPYPVAPPGQSEHQTGSCVDLGVSGMPQGRLADLAQSVGLKWAGNEDPVHFDFVGPLTGKGDPVRSGPMTQTDNAQTAHFQQQLEQVRQGRNRRLADQQQLQGILSAGMPQPQAEPQQDPDLKAILAAGSGETPQPQNLWDRAKNYTSNWWNSVVHGQTNGGEELGIADRLGAAIAPIGQGVDYALGGGLGQLSGLWQGGLLTGAGRVLNAGKAGVSDLGEQIINSANAPGGMPDLSNVSLGHVTSQIGRGWEGQVNANPLVDIPSANPEAAQFLQENPGAKELLRLGQFGADWETMPELMKPLAPVFRVAGQAVRLGTDAVANRADLLAGKLQEAGQDTLARRTLEANRTFKRLTNATPEFRQAQEYIKQNKQIESTARQLQARYTNTVLNISNKMRAEGKDIEGDFLTNHPDPLIAGQAGGNKGNLVVQALLHGAEAGDEGSFFSSPEEVLQIAADQGIPVKPLAQAIEEMKTVSEMAGQQMVKQNLLDPKVFAEHAGTYARRYYRLNLNDPMHREALIQDLLDKGVDTTRANNILMSLQQAGESGPEGQTGAGLKQRGNTGNVEGRKLTTAEDRMAFLPEYNALDAVNNSLLGQFRAAAVHGALTNIAGDTGLSAANQIINAGQGRILQLSDTNRIKAMRADVEESIKAHQDALTNGLEKTYNTQQKWVTDQQATVQRASEALAEHQLAEPQKPLAPLLPQKAAEGAEPPGAAKDRYYQELAEAPFGFQHLTPTVATTRGAVESAVTGRPVTLTGFRQEPPGGASEGIGKFYATDPAHAGAFGFRYSKDTPDYAEVRNGGSKSTLAVEGIHLKNPLVLEGGQDSFWTTGIEGKPINLTTVALNRIQDALSQYQDNLKDYDALTKVNRVIAEEVRKAGYDGVIYRRPTETKYEGGLVYRNGSEVVDLRRSPGSSLPITREVEPGRTENTGVSFNKPYIPNIVQSLKDAAEKADYDKASRQWVSDLADWQTKHESWQRRAASLAQDVTDRQTELARRQGYLDQTDQQVADWFAKAEQIERRHDLLSGAAPTDLHANDALTQIEQKLGFEITDPAERQKWFNIWKDKWGSRGQDIFDSNNLTAPAAPNGVPPELMRHVDQNIIPAVALDDTLSADGEAYNATNHPPGWDLWEGKGNRDYGAMEGRWGPVVVRQLVEDAIDPSRFIRDSLAHPMLKWAGTLAREFKALRLYYNLPTRAHIMMQSFWDAKASSNAAGVEFNPLAYIRGMKEYKAWVEGSGPSTPAVQAMLQGSAEIGAGHFGTVYPEELPKIGQEGTLRRFANNSQKKFLEAHQFPKAGLAAVLTDSGMSPQMAGQLADQAFVTRGPYAGGIETHGVQQIAEGLNRYGVAIFTSYPLHSINRFFQLMATTPEVFAPYPVLRNYLLQMSGPNAQMKDQEGEVRPSMVPIPGLKDSRGNPVWVDAGNLVPYGAAMRENAFSNGYGSIIGRFKDEQDRMQQMGANPDAISSEAIRQAFFTVAPSEFRQVDMLSRAFGGQTTAPYAVTPPTPLMALSPFAGLPMRYVEDATDRKLGLDRAAIPSRKNFYDLYIQRLQEGKETPADTSGQLSHRDPVSLYRAQDAAKRYLMGLWSDKSLDEQNAKKQIRHQVDYILSINKLLQDNANLAAQQSQEQEGDSNEGF